MIIVYYYIFQKVKEKENKYQYYHDQIRRDFEFVEKLSFWLDEKYRIPGIGFRFGLDPLINLIPFLGDIIGFILSTFLVVIMVKNGVSPKVVIKMLLNVLLDTIIGAIPIFGKFGDFFFKANTRNLELLKSHYFEGKNNGSGIGIIITILVVFFLLIFLIFLLLFKILSWCLEVIQSLF